MTATTPDAPPLGFWKIAETFPDHHQPECAILAA